MCGVHDQSCVIVCVCVCVCVCVFNAKQFIHLLCVTCILLSVCVRCMCSAGVLFHARVVASANVLLCMFGRVLCCL